ncbi:hypothetical protein EP04_01910 [Listeria monocytogenes]|nr:hypothetical protein [Listeria monocytogenes]
MRRFIIICKDIKDVWNEIDNISKYKSRYVTNIDNSNMIVTLENEQYIYREMYSTLDDCSDIDGWMLSYGTKSVLTPQILERLLVKLTNCYTR